MIRIAQEKDIPELMEIYNHAILNSSATFDIQVKDYEDRLEWFRSHQGRERLVVFEKEGTIAGYGTLSPYGTRLAFYQTLEISVYVGEHARRQGIGSAIMEDLLEYARSQEDIHTVVSLITGENLPSMDLHEKLGFQYCGVIKDAGFKFERYHDLRIYQIFFQRNQ